MKYLVTGSSGFIGSHLTAELRKRGHEVKECDPKAEGDAKADIRFINESFLQGIDIVFHLGAASGSLYFDPATDGVDVNCRGTINLLESARKAGVKKVVLASTGSSYGGTPLPHTENAVLNCPNFYTATKIFDEQAMRLYSELYDLDTVICRFASVYGDNEDKKGDLANVVSQFIWKMMRGEAPDLWQDGNQTRDFIFVDDIVYGLIFAAENLGKARVYNLGTGVETRFVDIVAKINQTLGTSVQPNFVGSALSGRSVQKKYVDRQLFNIDKIRKVGWNWTVTVDEGIKRIVENIRARKAA